MPFYKYPFCKIQDATRFPISRWFAAFVAAAGSLWSPCTPGSQSAEQQRWHLPKTPFWLGASPLSNTLAEYSVLSPLKSSLQFLAFYRLFRHWWFSSNPHPRTAPFGRPPLFRLPVSGFALPSLWPSSAVALPSSPSPGSRWKVAASFGRAPGPNPRPRPPQNWSFSCWNSYELDFLYGVSEPHYCLDVPCCLQPRNTETWIGSIHSIHKDHAVSASFSHQKKAAWPRCGRCIHSNQQWDPTGSWAAHLLGMGLKLLWLWRFIGPKPKGSGTTGTTNSNKLPLFELNQEILRVGESRANQLPCHHYFWHKRNLRIHAQCRSRTTKPQYGTWQMGTFSPFRTEKLRISHPYMIWPSGSLQ